MEKQTERAYDLYAAHALQALIMKLPPMNTEGRYGIKVDSTELRHIKIMLSRSAHKYAKLMIENRSEFLNTLESL